MELFTITNQIVQITDCQWYMFIVYKGQVLLFDGQFSVYKGQVLLFDGQFSVYKGQVLLFDGQFSVY